MLSINYEIGSLGVGAGLYIYDVVVKKFTFAISSHDEFLVLYASEAVAHWTVISLEHCITRAFCEIFAYVVQKVYRI